jgi:predicted Zn finger-like uncharacterized protein
MKFVCDRCQTKYSIADEKVRGKVLKVRCKTCQNVITVREAGARPSVSSLPPVRSQKPSTGPLATLGEGQDEGAERTSIAPAPAGLMADMLANQARRATPPPPPPLGDGIEWFLALDGAQQGPFSRKLLVDRLLALPKDADVHVWNDRMDGWKPPADVPEVAHDLNARKPPAVPVRPPVPKVTPAPPPPLAARRGTMPLTSGVGSKLPLPVPHVAGAHAVPAPHHAPSSEDIAFTPPPAAAHGAVPAATNGAAKSNGLSTHAASPASAFPGGDSDALSALNVATAGAAAKAPPRIMEVGEATAWSGAGRVQEGRHKNTKLALGLVAVVGVIIVVVAINFTHKAPAPVAAAPGKAGLDSEALAKLNEIKVDDVKVASLKPADPDPIEPPKGKNGRGRGPLRGRQQGRGVANAGPGATGAPAGTSTGPGEAPPASSNNGGGLRERGVTQYNAVANRPPPSQADITRVIANNKLGIKTCYQRALLRDSNLTHGKIVVGVTIGLSGRVKGVRVDGPASFRTLEPCIKEMVYRWTFPQSSDEYGTEFSYVFQGNE